MRVPRLVVRIGTTRDVFGTFETVEAIGHAPR